MKSLNEFLNESRKLKIGISGLNPRELKKRMNTFKPFKRVKKSKESFDVKLAKKKRNLMNFLKGMKLTEALEGEEKLNVLASFYGGEPDDYDEDDYIVVTDDEADELVKEYIEESIWAFNTSFIMDNLPSIEEINSNMGFEDEIEGDDGETITIDDPEEVFYLNTGMSLEEYIDYLKGMYEDGNNQLIDLIEDLDSFIEEAIASDGRGHFLSGYDGEENEEGDYFIYRIN